MGRKPKVVPIDNKISKISKDVVDAIEERTPICKSQVFDPPSTLTKDELKIWQWLVIIIKEMNGSYIADADKMTMEVFCKAKAEYDRACKKWDKNPNYYVKIVIGKDKNGNDKEQIKVNEFYQIKKDFSQLMIKYLSELGITPTGRARQGIQAAKTDRQNTKDTLTNLFNRKGD